MEIARKESAKETKKSAGVIANEAKRLCPVGRVSKPAQRTAYKRMGAVGASWTERKPGSLKNSIRVRKSKFEDGGHIVLVGNVDSYYWRWVELGAPAKNNYQRQPFMRPALERVKE
jgi:HK97 gp10 family phage protein